MKMELRHSIQAEEFDYQVLKSALGAYSSPRDRITTLMRSGVIVRVKKGLYVFGDDYRHRPVCKELLANLIFGPSFVSLQYALAYHGLIPERVNTVTSVTSGRARLFDTPVGRFVYRPTPCLSIGFRRIEEGQVAFLIATKERALADTIRDGRGTPITTQQQMKEYLFDDLRIEEAAILEMNPAEMDELAVHLNSRKTALCARVIKSIRRN